MAYFTKVYPYKKFSVISTTAYIFKFSKIHFIEEQGVSSIISPKSRDFLFKILLHFIDFFNASRHLFRDYYKHEVSQ